MSAESLVKARAVRDKRAQLKRRHQLAQAQGWLKWMREEARARGNYLYADEPRAKERARKYWLHTRDEWQKYGTPTDEALREARKLERSDR